MTVTFRDHFSAGSGAYAAHRPTYPKALARTLADLSPARRLAWDCATGSGQAAVRLAAHFDRVVATDASAAQIAHAEPAERVVYSVATASAPALSDFCSDLVTVAQAAHWLDLDPFYAEVRRVLRPGGLLAMWCYAGLQTCDPMLDAAVSAFQHGRVGPYWPEGREHVDTHYADLPFPFARVVLPPFTMTAVWTRQDLLAYVGTWSAVARCRTVEGVDPLPDFALEVASWWPDDAERREIRWPLYLLAGRP